MSAPLFRTEAEVAQQTNHPLSLRETVAGMGKSHSNHLVAKCLVSKEGMTNALAIFPAPTSVHGEGFYLSEVKVGGVMRSKSVQDVLEAVFMCKKGERLAGEEAADIAAGESLRQ